jgi:hypothetical protein
MLKEKVLNKKKSLKMKLRKIFNSGTIFFYYFALIRQKKKCVFLIAWSSKLGSVGRDF